MPFSPLTRGIAIILIASFAIILLWPDDLAYHIRYFAIAPLAIGLAGFTASAVANAAPFNDRSFHRSLPPGDQSAFLRVLRIHLLLLSGVVLSVLAYCLWFNFDWPSISYGLLAFTLPAWAFCGAAGIVASISSAGRGWRAAALAAILFVPLASIYLVKYCFTSRWGYIPRMADGEYYYLAPHRSMILVAAFAYPLIWWLVAVKRRKLLGLGLGALTSAVLPLVYFTGYYLPMGSLEEASASSPLPASSLGLVRKPLPELPKAAVKLSDMLEPTGLREGEFAHLKSLATLRDSKSLSWGPLEFRFHPDREMRGWDESIRDEIPPEVIDHYLNLEEPTHEPWIYVGNVGGRIVWGEQAVWEYLRGKIPPHESFHYWNADHDQPGSLRTYNTSLRVSLGSGETVGKRWEAAEQRWGAWLSGTIQWELAGEVSAASGGTLRVPEGVIKISTKRYGGAPSLSLKRYEAMSRAGGPEGPWFGAPSASAGLPPMVILVDASGKHAFALDTLVPYGFGGTALGSYQLFVPTNYANPKDQGPEAGREALRNGRLYVFTAVMREGYREVELVPP